MKYQATAERVAKISNPEEETNEVVDVGSETGDMLKVKEIEQGPKDNHRLHPQGLPPN